MRVQITNDGAIRGQAKTVCNSWIKSIGHIALLCKAWHLSMIELRGNFVIKQLWAFLGNPKNLAVMGLIGGAVAFLWKIAEPRWFPVEPEKQVKREALVTPPTTQSAVASDNGTAINARDNAIVGNSGSVSGPTASKTEPLNQNAEASSGGRAINAAGSARVNVGDPPPDEK